MKQKNISSLSDTKLKIFLILVIPSLILIAFGIVNNIYHINNHKKLLISNYSNELNSFLKDTEDKLTLTINSAPFIATSNEINYALTSSQKPDTLTTATIVSSLKQTTNFLDIIDSVIIYNKNANFVITPTGLYDSDIYFNSIYPYNKYQYEYWSKYRSITGKIQILAPSTITNDTSDQTKTVVPLVFTSLGNIASNNLVIFNINMNTVFQNFELHRLTPNTNIYMIDNNTGNIYSDDKLTIADKLEYTFLQSIKNSLQSNTGIIKIDNEKHLLIKSTQRSNSWGYTYLVTVPYSDISKEVTAILFMSLVLIIALSIIIALFLIYGSAYLYSPWLKIATAIGTPAGKMPKNLTDYAITSFSALSNTNTQLKNSLEKVLPYKHEQYLINVLNNNIINSENENEDFISQNFQYEYFASISVNITINPEFLASQNTAASVLQRRMQESIKSMFSENFITYQLPGSKNIMYLLLNLDNDLCKDKIDALINGIKNLLESDRDNLSIIFSAGKIYSGLDGLKLTHQESLSNMMHHLSTSEIQFSTSKNIDLFSANTEKVLSNYLNLGFVDKGKELLTDIFNNLSDVPVINQKHVYIDIANCIKKILIQKNIQPSVISIEYILEMLNKDTGITSEQIQDGFFLALDKIDEHMQLNSKKINIEDIIAYINEHYAENIFLDELAQKYNVSSKYLSKRIKQHLDMTFKEYTTSLKIEKAKELLSSSDITISELFSKVGFQDRVSFTRTFKQKTGLSPSEYKKNIHQST